MKSKIIALALFALTAATVVFYPTSQSIGAVALPPAEPLTNQPPKVEVVFVLDTTGSMGGLIQAAKEKIWSIATTLASAQPAPEIRMGLVAYRDRGDDYVTRVVDLSADLDSVYATLMDFQAAGGGDGPESVNQALHDAVHNVSWSQNPNAYQVVFLVGDAPPHMDYQDDIKYPATVAEAKQRGIVVNAVQCGRNAVTTGKWRQIAQLGRGRYFRVDQAGSAIAIATPFDEKLARLSRELDRTRLYYGTADQKARRRQKLEAAAKLHAGSSVESRARRAAFNASTSGAANFLGEGELVDDVSSGRVDISTIDRDKLPRRLHALKPPAQKALITETAERRRELQKQIKELSGQRSAFLREKVAESGGGTDSLDHKIYSAVREQAAVKGLQYKAEAPDY